MYAGGAFTSVQDATATTTVDRVVRLTANGSLDRTWSASISANDRVRVLLLSPARDALYIRGDFTALAGSSAYGKLAKVGTGATATVDTNFRSGANNNGNRSPVYDLDLVGSSLLIASGGGGGGCTRQDAATGRTSWSHHGTGDIVAVKVLGPYVYCGGHFSGSDSFEGLDRDKAAEVALSTGAITGWAPRINSAMGVWAMADTPSALVVGGDFTRTSGNYQPHLGQFRDRSSLTVPSAPVGLHGVPGDKEVTLEWGQPDTDGGTQVSRYLILRANAAGDFTQVGNTASASFTDTGLTNGTTYRYAVRASTTVGDGPASAPVTAGPEAGLVFPHFSVTASFDTTSTSLIATFRDLDSITTSSAVRGITAQPRSGQALGSWGTASTDGCSPITRHRVLRREGPTAPMEIGVTTPQSGLTSCPRCRVPSPRLVRWGRSFRRTPAPLGRRARVSLSVEGLRPRVVPFLDRRDRGHPASRSVH